MLTLSFKAQAGGAWAWQYWVDLTPVVISYTDSGARTVCMEVIRKNPCVSVCMGAFALPVDQRGLFWSVPLARSVPFARSKRTSFCKQAMSSLAAPTADLLRQRHDQMHYGP